MRAVRSGVLDPDYDGLDAVLRRLKHDPVALL